MDEVDEFMEQEACDTMDTVTVFDLPCGPLVRYRKVDEQEDTGKKTPYSHEWTEADKRRFKRDNRARKKENERLLKLTEALTDEEVINRFAERNRGHVLVRHTVINILICGIKKEPCYSQ